MTAVTPTCFRSCLLGGSCRCPIGEKCQEPLCEFYGGPRMLIPEPLDHSRGQAWWDNWYLGLARHAASASRDPSTQTGAVIVRPDKTIASFGYNGFPRGCDDSPDLYADRAVKYSRIIHCEMNAVLNAREPLRGYTLYTVPFLSCDRCCVHMIQAGIARAVAPVLTGELLHRWGESVERTKALFVEAGVEVHEFVGAH